MGSCRLSQEWARDHLGFLLRIGLFLLLADWDLSLYFYHLYFYLSFSHKQLATGSHRETPLKPTAVMGGGRRSIDLSRSSFQNEISRYPRLKFGKSKKKPHTERLPTQHDRSREMNLNTKGEERERKKRHKARSPESPSIHCNEPYAWVRSRLRGGRREQNDGESKTRWGSVPTAWWGILGHHHLVTTDPIEKKKRTLTL